MRESVLGGRRSPGALGFEKSMVTERMVEPRVRGAHGWCLL